MTEIGRVLFLVLLGASACLWFAFCTDPYLARELGDAVLRGMR